MLKYASLVAIVLLLFNGLSIGYLVKSLNDQSRALKIDQRDGQIAVNLLKNVETKSSNVRTYLESGSDRFLQAYQREDKESIDVDQTIKQLKNDHLPDETLALAEYAIQQSTHLKPIEEQAIDHVKAEESAKAKDLLYGSQYSLLKDNVSNTISSFNNKLSQWTEAQVQIR